MPRAPPMVVLLRSVRVDLRGHRLSRSEDPKLDPAEWPNGHGDRPNVAGPRTAERGERTCQASVSTRSNRACRNGTVTSKPAAASGSWHSVNSTSRLSFTANTASESM